MSEHTHNERLLPRIQHLLRMRHYSRRTEDVYLGWVRRFIEFHGLRHPKEMGEAEVSAFLSSTDGGVSGWDAESRGRRSHHCMLACIAREGPHGAS